MFNPAKSVFVAYKGNSFSVYGQLFFPLNKPLIFDLNLDKTEVMDGNQDNEQVSFLKFRVEFEGEEMWMNEDYEIVTLLPNSNGKTLYKLQQQYKAEILAFNGIFLPEE